MAGKSGHNGKLETRRRKVERGGSQARSSRSLFSPRSGFVQETTSAVGERVGELRKGEEIEGEGAVFIGDGSKLHGGPAHGIPGGNVDGDSLLGKPDFKQADGGH